MMWGEEKVGNCWSPVGMEMTGFTPRSLDGASTVTSRNAKYKGVDAGRVREASWDFPSGCFIFSVKWAIGGVRPWGLQSGW